MPSKVPVSDSGAAYPLTSGKRRVSPPLWRATQAPLRSFERAPKPARAARRAALGWDATRARLRSNREDVALTCLEPFKWACLAGYIVHPYNGGQHSRLDQRR
jgi:hypothetical protein